MKYRRILLVDDFSGVHLNLLKMLCDDKYSATLLTSGDGYKEMKYDDLNLPIAKLNFNSWSYLIKLLKYSHNVDLVQFINLYRPNIYANLFLIFILRILGKEVRYYAVGTDPSFLLGGKYLRHFAWENSNTPNYSWLSRKAFRSIINMVAVFVPNKSYSIGFEKMGLETKQMFYPRFPLELGLKRENQTGEASVIYAPVSRRGFKGYDYIEAACNNLELEYPQNMLIVRKTTRIPFKDYINNVKNCDILIDQCLSSDYAMNAILGMESGKVVLCGVSIEHLKWLGIQPDECPVIDILPEVQNIYKVCKGILKAEESENSFDLYLEKYHGKGTVLSQFFS